jgi:hypothetical protein
MAGTKSSRDFSSESVSRASTRVWREQSDMRSALLGRKNSDGSSQSKMRGSSESRTTGRSTSRSGKTVTR